MHNSIRRRAHVRGQAIACPTSDRRRTQSGHSRYQPGLVTRMWHHLLDELFRFLPPGGKAMIAVKYFGLRMLLQPLVPPHAGIVLLFRKFAEHLAHRYTLKRLPRFL